MSAKKQNSALRKLSGIRRSAATVDELEQLADALGWRCIPLDGTEVADKDAFLEQCAVSFGLPEWFGMNWDALEECLGELDLDTEGVVVLWSEWAEFAEAEPADFAVALDVFMSAAHAWREDGVKGGIVLVGPGPNSELEVPEL